MEYLPARLVRGHRWYIVYYTKNPVNQEWTRERKTFRLNRIKDKRQRAILAASIIDDLNSKLPAGWPWNEIDPHLEKKQMKIIDAIQLATKVKCITKRQATKTFYNSHSRSLIRWIEKEKLQHLKIISFNKNHALAYLDHALINRGISNTTYNVYLKAYRAMWSALLDRNYIIGNVWTTVEKRRAEVKKREPFTASELQLIAETAAKKDIMLLLSINLLLYCFLRNSEQRRLKIKDIDLQNGYINITPDTAKMHIHRRPVIPDVMMSIFKKLELDKLPGNYFLFGSKFKPHPAKQCGRNEFGRRMKLITKELGFDKEKTFYSLKDSGAIELLKEGINIISIMNQLGHTSLNTTQIYLQKFNSNDSIKSQKSKL